MIDTVVLSIPVSRRDIKNLKQFSPSAENIFTTDRGFRSYKRNPTSVERKLAKYVPIYTLYRRYRHDKQETEIDLQIQFSIPKLIYKNNFQEVCEYDWEEIITQLEHHFFVNQIHIEKKRLEEAKISAIHYSKNILLSNGLNCSMVLNQLFRSIDTNRQLDFTQVIFKNGGQTLHIHSNSYEFAMYDKVQELKQAKRSQKRSIDPQGYIQYSLLDALENTENYFRLELRLNGRRAIKEKIRIFAPDFAETPLIFKDLFNRDLSKAILTNYWNKMIRSRYVSINWKEKNQYSSLIELKANNPAMKDRDLILISSLNAIIRDKGIATLRSTFGWVGKQSYKWLRYKKLLNSAKQPQSKMYIIDDIDKQLKDFSLFRHIPESIRLDISPKMLNTDKDE